MSTHEHLPQLSRTLLFHASFPKLDVNRSIFVYLWLSESLCKFSLSAWWNLPSALRDSCTCQQNYTGKNCDDGELPQCFAGFVEISQDLD